jgi:hypothetical protein
MRRKIGYGEESLPFFEEKQKFPRRKIGIHKESLPFFEDQSKSIPTNYAKFFRFILALATITIIVSLISRSNFRGPKINRFPLLVSGIGKFV